MVGGHADVGGAVLKHPNHRQQDATHGGDLGAVVSFSRGLSIEVTEQLVGPVDEVHFHWASLAPRQGQGTAGAFSPLPRMD